MPMNVQRYLRSAARAARHGFAFSTFLPLFFLTALTATPSRSYAQQSTTNASLVLTVRDGDTLRPLIDVRIAVHDLGRAAVTDTTGMAVIHDISPGEHRITVALTGYESLDFTVGFEGGVTADGEVDLVVSPFELPELIVEAERPARIPFLANRGFYRRSGGGFPGRFFDRREIDAMHTAFIEDIFRRLPGVRVVTNGWGDSYIASRRRVRGSISRYRDNPDARPLDCVLTVLVDGVAWNQSIDRIPINWVAGLELYTGVVPAEFSLWSNACGLIVIWTG